MVIVVAMEKVTGIGGVFFKSRDPAALQRWYREQLGIESEGGAATFRWGDGATVDRPGSTVWSAFPADTKYFGPGSQTLMVNYRVRDVGAMLAQLRAAGGPVDEKIEASEFGRFGWATDPEGNRFELWEPPPGW